MRRNKNSAHAAPRTLALAIAIAAILLAVGCSSKPKSLEDVAKVASSMKLKTYMDAADFKCYMFENTSSVEELVQVLEIVGVEQCLESQHLIQSRKGPKGYATTPEEALEAVEKIRNRMSKCRSAMSYPLDDASDAFWEWIETNRP